MSYFIFGIVFEKNTSLGTRNNRNAPLLCIDRLSCLHRVLDPRGGRWHNWNWTHIVGQMFYKSNQTILWVQKDVRGD
jgi:hypothetical protein